MGRGSAPRIELFRKIYKDRFFYQLYFQEPGVAEAELEADVRTSLRKIYYWASGEAIGKGLKVDKPADARLLDGLSDPEPFPAWLTPADLDYYVGEFQLSGFRGPLNRYRTSELDFSQLAAVADRRIEQPAAFIGGSLDPVLRFVPGVDMIETMRARMADLRLVRIIEGAGHWVQQERPRRSTRRSPRSCVRSERLRRAGALATADGQLSRQARIGPIRFGVRLAAPAADTPTLTRQV